MELNVDSVLRMDFVVLDSDDVEVSRCAQLSMALIVAQAWSYRTQSTIKIYSKRHDLVIFKFYKGEIIEAQHGIPEFGECLKSKRVVPLIIYKMDSVLSH